MSPSRRVLGIGLALALAGSATPLSDARASHYRLTTGFSLVTSGERAALATARIETTAGLFDRTAKTTARRKLAKETGISFARLTELATQCDLLRIRGLGPSAVRLLQAAKVRHAANLRGAEPERLHQRLDAIRKTLDLSRVIPTTEEIQDWQRQARQLPKLLQGVR